MSRNAYRRVFTLSGEVNIPESKVAKFWSRVDVLGVEDCWNWKFGKNKAGYGQFCMMNRDFISSRVAYCIANGGIPKNTIICHKCDNPACCNPNHLYAGTFEDNYKDSVNRERLKYSRVEKKKSALSAAFPERYGIVKGSTNGRSRLTESDVIELRRLRKEGILTLREIAKRFDVSRSCVCHVLAGRCWTHLVTS